MFIPSPLFSPAPHPAVRVILPVGSGAPQVSARADAADAIANN